MSIKTTMTGSFFRSEKILSLLRDSPTGEIDSEFHEDVLKAEREAIRDQMHPMGQSPGLNWVSNGEQRKSGYTTFLPNRFTGFSKTERALPELSEEFFRELAEANPIIVAALRENSPLSSAKITDRLTYTGSELAKSEALDARGLAKKEGAERIFVPSPSPGVITIFYPNPGIYKDHTDFLFSLSKELRKEYTSILSVDGVDLQIDAPDLAMSKSIGVKWDKDFYEAVSEHVDAINEAIAGLPTERIRVHYCYGNYSSSHLLDPPFEKILPELLRLKVGTIVGEFSNARHEGDSVILRRYVKENGWPSRLKYAAGVIDVKSPFVETPETVAVRLERISGIDDIGPGRTIGGTDCGFETFVGMGNVPKSIGLNKLSSLAKGAKLVGE